MRMTKLLLIGLAVCLGPFTAMAADTNIIGWGWSSTAALETNVPPMGTNVIALAGSDIHCVALLADRTVRAWGQNYSGSGQTNVPLDVTNATAISAGNYNSLAAQADGTVRMWGRMGNFGALYVPVAATNVVALGVGRGALHALALRADGVVVDWGYNSTTNIPASAFNIVSVAAGSFHSLAVRADGRVIAWGDNTSGQTTVPANATNIVAVAAGEQNSLAVRADGTLLRWGSIATPPASATNVVEVGCCKSGEALALRRDGTVVGWGAPKTISATNAMVIGADSYGALAVRAAGPPIFPFPAIRRTVASGQTAYLRLRAVGALPLTHQWQFYGTNLPGANKEVLVVTNALPSSAGLYSVVASNALGVITNSDMELVVMPFIMATQPTNQAVYVGANPTLNVSVFGQSPSYQWSCNGTNITWATNSSMTLTNIQLTDAGLYSVSVSNEFGGIVSSNASVEVWPILVTSPPQDQVSFRGATTTFSIAAQAGSPLSYQWKFNGAVLLEPTTSTLALTNTRYEHAGVYTVIASTANAVVTNMATLSVVPVAAWGSGSYGKTNVPPDLTNVIALAAGQIHSLALKNDGTVVAWRYDSIRTNVPLDLTNAVAISAGDSGSLALRADGTIAAWGYNNRGQTNIPPDLTNVVAVAAGSYHNIALKSDGTVTAWGQNDSGQTNVPAGLANVVAVEAGDYSSLALTADGRVVAWGYNGNGQTNVPGNLSNVVAIAAGRIHCIALKSGGIVAVWGGTNSYGLGNVPATATNIVAVDAGFGHCLVLRDDGTVIAWGYPYNAETAIPTGLQHVTTIACGSSHNLALVEGSPFNSPVLATNPTWSTNGFKLTVPTRSGRVYRLEYKADLSDSNWIALPLVAGTGRALTLTDPTATGTQRFYRVRQW